MIAEWSIKENIYLNEEKLNEILESKMHIYHHLPLFDEIDDATEFYRTKDYEFELSSKYLN